MDVIHDIIAAVVSPGWKYGLSRILVNSDNRGAVFIVGEDAPLAEFTVTGVATSRGSGELDGGGEITWRRRGSSCQYKLAKCKINTATMTERWEAALAVKADPVKPVDSEKAAADLDTANDTAKSEPAEEAPLDGPPEVEKPKRKRRTKAEIEADNAAKAAEDLL